jgi:hypothetical protein
MILKLLVQVRKGAERKLIALALLMSSDAPAGLGSIHLR